MSHIRSVDVSQAEEGEFRSYAEGASDTRRDGSGALANGRGMRSSSVGSNQINMQELQTSSSMTPLRV